MPFTCRTVWCVWFIVSVLAAGPSHGTELRRFTPDDVLKSETVVSAALSPDGRSVAYVKCRPWGDVTRTSTDRNARADIWVVRFDEDTPVNITRGDADDSGWWEPVWSPDGKSLAMLSTRGDRETVRLWIWNENTRRLTRPTDRSVALDAEPTFAWVDNQRLVTILEAAGDRTQRWDNWYASMSRASREWQNARAGKVSTASVLDSGVLVDLSARPQQSLQMINISGEARELGSASWIGFPRVSPDRQYVAFLRRTALIQPDATRPLFANPQLNVCCHRYDDRQELMIVSLGGSAEHRVEGEGRYVVPGMFEWAPNGREFAFIGVNKNGDQKDLRVFRGTLDGAIIDLPLPAQDPKHILWVDNSRLLVQAAAAVDGGEVETAKGDWWLLSPAERPRNLTKSLDDVGDAVCVGTDRRECAVVASGDLWRLNSRTMSWTSLSATFDPRIASIELQNRGMGLAGASGYVQSILVSVSTTGPRELYRSDLRFGTMTKIERPSAHAELEAYDVKTDTAVFVARERDGTFVTLQRSGNRCRVDEMNTFLREVAQGEVRIIDYTSLDGDRLKGVLILPVDYKAGRRSPMVTWVYASKVFRDEADYVDGAMTNFDLQLFASHGYAVLMPSMPLVRKPAGSIVDALPSITNGVIPAIDKAIELGIADPARIAVAGQSFGGYSTYAIITQTTRFKAAIAVSGWADFIAAPGLLSAFQRYNDDAHEKLNMRNYVETRMGDIPWWNDYLHYLRNSPIMYVDRVRTPLLIIHGDMDFVDISGAEQFFAALLRQGRRARFVRYAGENHAFYSPANMRDLWKQIYAWLDAFMSAIPASGATQP